MTYRLFNFKDIMNTLEQINCKLSELNSQLIAYSKSLNFEEICEFSMARCQDIPWESLDVTGVYLIEVKNNTSFTDFPSWVEHFKMEWEDSLYKRKFVPNIKLKRVRTHTELGEWIPLYIGKSKKIRGRLHQHIYSDLNKTTFALKLYAREHAKKELFRLSIIPIPFDNYNWIVPVIESTLRDKINPIIGKQ